MECFFINLGGATERREFLQGNFARHKAPGWYLTRVEAIGLPQLAARPAPGRIEEKEKGCFLSHRLAIEQSLEAPGHALIMEDDAMFGPHSCLAIESAVASVAEDAWDLMFTDLAVVYPPMMAALLQNRRTLGEGGQILLNLGELAYAGATAYVVNSRFKTRLLELLGGPTLDIPYDLCLRDLIDRGLARGLLTFPFATTLSHFADHSQIGHNDTLGLMWNAFRRFIWVDRDLAEVDAAVRGLGTAMVDEESAVFARIIATAFHASHRAPPSGS